MTFQSILDDLNKYANLLLILITGIYVWLTWRNLRALQRASLRERELRHLEDIKKYVIGSLIEWIDREAEPKLKSHSPLIQVKTIAVPKPGAALGDLAWDYPRQLDSTLNEPTALSSDLYLHTRNTHFAGQIEEFEAFLQRVQHVISECVTLARTCAERSANSTRLPRVEALEKNPEAADSDSLVEICLRDVLLGRPKPQIAFSSPPSSVTLQVSDGYSGKIVGKGPTEPVRLWAENCVGQILDEWPRSGLQARIQQLLDDAKGVRRLLERLQFTYNLPGDCEYVGGKAPSILARIVERLKL